MSKTGTNSMGLTEWGLLVFLSILWGGSFFFSKVALAELRPFSVVFMRVLLAAATLWLVLFLTQQAVPHSRKLWRLFFIMGALNNLIPFSLIFWGQTHISSGLASILNATTPLWAIILAHFYTADEKLTTNRFIGIICGVIGVAVMIGPDALSGSGGMTLLAQLAVIAGTFSYACSGIFGKRFQGIPPMVTATGQVSATTIMMIPLVLWVDQPWLYSWPQLSTWGALAGLAILSTALAYIIYFRLLATAGATNLLLVTLLIPVSATLLGITFLDETIAAQEIIGMGCIAIGLLVLDGRLFSIWRKNNR